ncbi:DUF3574 domain-containing protein [Hydrocarboniphaga sp.]|uniref:DUF3574 domain-containing protein n=1 Tax=Hydrocarboniphaga sp. TaxID=2033016 RepID=UPI003455828C
MLCACVSAPTSVDGTAATLQGDAAHPPQTQNWIRTELYFGIGLVDQPDKGISDAQWREFLDRELSSRFPDGLSVFDIYGQWRGKQQSKVERLHSKVIVLLHPDGPQQRADIEAIRAAWKRMTGDQSVLRVSQPADVSF